MLSLLLFAGCAGGPQGPNAKAPDWQDSSVASVVAASTPLAPSVSAAPENTAIKPSTNASARRTDSTGSEFSDPAVRWVPLQRWSRATGLATLSRLDSSAPPAYALNSQRSGLVLHPGSRNAQSDGIELRLGFAPQLIDEQPYVHALDLNKTIVPLLSPASGKSRSEPVVIDPGHGGDDAGTISVLRGEREKDLTLDWALRLKRALAAKGFNVLLTRSTDANIALSNRVALAVAAHAGTFISLHFNSAAPNHSEAGLETYCLTPAGMPSTLIRNYPDDLDQAFPNNAFDAGNLRLAAQIHRALLQVNGHQDRGVRRARFPAVLRGQQCPAVLIEGGYLSNPAEARLIAEPAYRQKLADAIAGALESRLGKPAASNDGDGTSPPRVGREEQRTAKNSP